MLRFASGLNKLVPATLVAAFLLAACSTSGLEPQETGGLGCVDDSRECIDMRQAALKSLLADRERRWIREPATPKAYASGVRMFAYKTKKRELTCDELAAGRREAEGAPAALRGAGGQLSPAQVSRGAMFAAEVSRELSVEMQRRCRA